MKATYFLAAIIVGMFLVSGCASSSNESGQATRAQQAQEQVQQQAQQPTANGQQPSASVKKFTVEGTEFKFMPSEIKASKGDVVEVTFKNAGTYGHNFVVEGYEKRTSIINKGKEEILTFTADKAGTFAFYCSVNGH